MPTRQHPARFCPITFHSLIFQIDSRHGTRESNLHQTRSYQSLGALVTSTGREVPRRAPVNNKFVIKKILNSSCGSINFVITSITRISHGLTYPTAVLGAQGPAEVGLLKEAEAFEEDEKDG